MSTNNFDFDIKSSTQQKSCSNVFALGCKSCMRLPGIPIFPVRYSACSIDGNGAIPKLPNDIISAFTSITLDQYIDNEESIKKGSPFNRYILRKLRKGYMYIYDEIYGGQWQCFGIYPSGELIAFAPEAPIPITSLNNFSCKTPENSYISSIVTIPNGESRNIYVSYVEYPWSIQHMDRLKNDVSMRQDCMQEYKITSSRDDTIKSNNGLLRSYSEITDYLPEYNSKYSKYALGKIDITSIVIPDSPLKTKEKTEEQHAIENALSSVAHDRQSHPGLMMIVHDEIGLIEQLKNLRQEPYNRTQIKVIERPNGLGLRELYWLQSVQKLEEGISLQFEEEIKEIYKKDSPEAHEQFIKEGTKLFEGINENQRNPSPFDIDNYSESSRVVKFHDQEIQNTSLMRSRVISEFRKYYDNDKRKYLEEYFDPCIEDFEKSKFILDANYCDWIRHHLEHALKRYDTTVLEYSAYAVHILGSLLDEGSILTINSQRLWQWLHEESTNNSSSILARGICCNHDETRSHYNASQLTENDPKDLKSNPEEFESNEAPSVFTDTLKIKNWYDVVKKGQKLHEKWKDIRTKELTTPLNAWRAGWKDFWKPYKQLQQALTTSRIALYQKHLAQLRAEIPISWKNATNVSPTLKQLQIAGAIEAAIANEPVESRTFGISKTKVSYETLLKSVEINNNNYKKYSSTSFHDYTPSSFKTGSKNTSSKASGNFTYGIKELYQSTENKNIKEDSKENNGRFYTSEKNQQINSSSEKIQKAKGDLVELNTSHKINYFAISDMHTDIPEAILSDEEKVLIAEQEKVAEAWTKGKSSVIYANLIMSFLNMKNAINSLGKKDAGLEEWWKVIGSSIATLQAAGDLMSNVTSYRSANALRVAQKLDLAKKANILKFETSLLGKTIAIIGIIDSLITFAKAYQKYKNGGTTRDMHIEMAIGTLSLLGSIISLSAGSAVLAPVLLTLIILIIGLSFLLTHLVPKNIENWLRRSLYGKDQETVKGKIFQSMEIEQSSLQMVLKGITVDVELDHAILKSESSEDLKTYVFKSKIEYPKNINENIEMTLKNNMNGNKIATITRNTDGEIKNIFLGKIAMSRLSEKELSIIKNKTSAENFYTIDITYIIGINRDIEKTLDLSFEILLSGSLKRDVFYVSI
ncbi:T6SS effector BTH_I2691 family protein [Zymobacter palmae]|nr:T6SS effector BTH_I2691 family protein [Zymobacter palmae]